MGRESETLKDLLSYMNIANHVDLRLVVDSFKRWSAVEPTRVGWSQVDDVHVPLRMQRRAAGRPDDEFGGQDDAARRRVGIRD